MAFQRLLPALLLAACAWYLARIAAAVLLLGLSRFKPGCARAAHACAPAALRPLIRRALVTGLVGAALSGTGALAAAEDGCLSQHHLVLDRGRSCAAAPVGEPQAEPQADAGPEPDRYVVRAGDSLWRITSDLRPGSAPAQIARAWPLLWRANQDSIGDDPGLIRPGLELVVPAEVVQ